MEIELFQNQNSAENAERNSFRKVHKMFCSKCGKTIPDDSVFCPECGASIGEQQASVTESAGKEVSNEMNIAIIVASIFIPLVGLIMGIIYMNDKDIKKQKTGKVWLWVGIGMVIFWILVVSGG